MTTVSAIAPSFLSRLIAFMAVEPRSPHRTGRLTTSDQADMDRARREFINDTIETFPDAFTSDLDIQFMMQGYPGKF